jgi:hypothetical protein
MTLSTMMQSREDGDVTLTVWDQTPVAAIAASSYSV